MRRAALPLALLAATGAIARTPAPAQPPATADALAKAGLSAETTAKPIHLDFDGDGRM